jgi:flagellar motor switch protein FliG
MVTEKFSGPEKAAILLMALGEESASKIFSQMEEREIQTLGNYISALGDIDTASMDEVTVDFYKAIESGSEGLEVAGIDFFKSTLMKTLDPTKAAEIINNISTPGEDMGGGLDTVRMLEPKVIASFLSGEHPQTSAIVMAHLDAATASATLKELSEEMRLEIVHRLSTLDRVSPKILRELDEALRAEFRTSGAASGNKMGGITATAQIMGSLDRETESSILAGLDEVDPGLSSEIRNLRFTFEDILKIDDIGLQQLLKEIAPDDLLIGLKTASEELKDKVFSNMSERASNMLKEDLESLGPTRITEVDKAQKKAVAICKRLEEEGRIIIGGIGEELV